VSPIIAPQTFKAIVDAFWLERREQPRLDMLNGPMDNQLGRSLINRELAAAFIAFHDERAKLRIISRTEHRALKSKPAEQTELALDGGITDEKRTASPQEGQAAAGGEEDAC
jgi:hypothetical protein